MLITFEQLKKAVEALRDFILALIPKRTSELINDSDFVVKSEVPTKTSGLVNDSGFITADDIDITELAPPDWNADNGKKGYIENKPSIYEGDSGGLKNNLGDAIGSSAMSFGTSTTQSIVYISGNANATSYRYTFFSPTWYQIAMIETGKVKIRANGVIAYITAIDTTARTITVDSTLSTSALSNQSANILFTTTASGNSSVAVGRSVYSTGTSSFAYGSYNLASGNDSVASGVQTVSSGTQSSTKGKGTIANHKSQDVSGEYNIEDSNVSANTERGTYVEIVGNGTTENARSNARTLDWSGNEWLSGTLKIGGTGYTDANAKEISTKEYVDNAIAALEVSLKAYVDDAIARYVQTTANMSVTGTTLNILGEE